MDQKSNIIVSVGLGCYNRTPQTGWLTQPMFISHSSGGWKSKVEMPAGLVLGEDPLPGLRTATIWLRACMAFVWWCKCRESSCARSFRKGINSTIRTPPQPNRILIASQRPHLQTPSPWRLGLLRMDGGETQAFRSQCYPILFLFTSPMDF